MNKPIREYIIDSLTRAGFVVMFVAFDSIKIMGVFGVWDLDFKDWGMLLRNYRERISIQLDRDGRELV